MTDAEIVEGKCEACGCRLYGVAEAFPVKDCERDDTWRPYLGYQVQGLGRIDAMWPNEGRYRINGQHYRWNELIGAIRASLPPIEAD